MDILIMYSCTETSNVKKVVKPADANQSQPARLSFGRDPYSCYGGHEFESPVGQNLKVEDPWIRSSTLVTQT
jgi:hypothetical protein